MPREQDSRGGAGRRLFLRQAGLVCAVATLPGLNACVPSRPLRVMIHDWPGYAFLSLAEHQGLLPASRIELLEESGMASSVAALEAGQVDAAALTLDNVLLLRARGVDLVVVLLFNVSSGGDALLAPVGRASLADLAGARVGAEETALSAVMLNRALAAAGLQGSDIQRVAFSGDAVKAWEGGGLDAILTYQPAVQQLLKRGLQVVFDSRQTPFLIVDVLAVRREVLAAQAGNLRLLIQGHFAAQRRWRDDPLNGNFALAAELGVEVGHVREVFRGINIPDEHYNRQYLTAPAGELRAAAGTLCDIMREEEACMAGPQALDDLFLPDYLPEFD